MRTALDIMQEAQALFDRGEVEQAAMIYDRLLCQMESPDPNILLGYGTILVAQQKFGVGISMLRTGLAVYDKHPLGWCNLGVAYKFIGRDDLALAAYDRAIELDPNMPEVLAGIAGYWINKDSPQKVIDYSDRALKVNPMLPAARMHLGMGLLEQGRFQDAWMHYEFRWDTAERVNDQRPYKAPRWEGEKVKTLAIHGEQGLGDEIMFMSLLREARKRADRVIVECAERLVRTFSEGFGVPCYPNHAALIESEGEPDAYIPMGSLPLVLGMPDGKPYLPKPVLPGPRNKPLIGIAWRGGTVRTNFSDRTLKLSDLQRLLRMKNFDFVSVQYGGDEVPEEAEKMGLFCGARDFDSLQTQIGMCDLVITVCQTALHQAGAMGVPCWVLTPRKAPWVCCTDPMPWYNSVKIMRQEIDGEWIPVIDRVATELKKQRASAAA